MTPKQIHTQDGKYRRQDGSAIGSSRGLRILKDGGRMSILIAWALIGAIHFAGILAEHRNWDLRDALQVIPCAVMVVALWPVGLVWWWFAFNRRRNRRG